MADETTTPPEDEADPKLTALDRLRDERLRASGGAAHGSALDKLNNERANRGLPTRRTPQEPPQEQQSTSPAITTLRSDMQERYGDSGVTALDEVLTYMGDYYRESGDPNLITAPGNENIPALRNVVALWQVMAGADPARKADYLMMALEQQERGYIDLGSSKWNANPKGMLWEMQRIDGELLPQSREDERPGQQLMVKGLYYYDKEIREDGDDPDAPDDHKPNINMRAGRRKR